MNNTIKKSFFLGASSPYNLVSEEAPTSLSCPNVSLGLGMPNNGKADAPSMLRAGDDRKILAQ